MNNLSFSVKYILPRIENVVDIANKFFNSHTFKSETSETSV